MTKVESIEDFIKLLKISETIKNPFPNNLHGIDDIITSSVNKLDIRDKDAIIVLFNSLNPKIIGLISKYGIGSEKFYSLTMPIGFKNYLSDIVLKVYENVLKEITKIGLEPYKEENIFPSNGNDIPTI